MLNPSILDWVDGINSLWQKPVQLLTNGTRLNQVPNLYDQLIQFREPDINARNWIGVSLHNPRDRQLCFSEIRKFLRGSITYVHRDDECNQDNAHTMGGDHAFEDQNGMKICVWEYTDFYTAAVKRNSKGRFTLHNSDPAKAYGSCSFAMSKCLHFVKGSLYKCGPVALFPEFDQQHDLDISAQDRNLINAYRPLTVDKVDAHGKDFVSSEQPLPQCKFCPENLVSAPLYAVSKKPNSQSCYD